MRTDEYTFSLALETSQGSIYAGTGTLTATETSSAITFKLPDDLWAQAALYTTTARIMVVRRFEGGHVRCARLYQGGDEDKMGTHEQGEIHFELDETPLCAFNETFQASAIEYRFVFRSRPQSRVGD